MILLLLLELTTVATFSLRKSRRKLLSSFSSSTHTSNQKRVEMMKKQKHPRPWWDETKFFANPSPSKGPSEKDLLVLADYYTAEGEYLGGHVPTGQVPCRPQRRVPTDVLADGREVDGQS